MVRWLAYVTVLVLVAGCASPGSPSENLAGRVQTLRALNEAKKARRFDLVVDITSNELARSNLDSQWRASMFQSRGLSHLMRNDYAGAISDSSASISLDPSNHSPYVTRGIAYKATGQFRLALSDLDKAMELKPEYDWVRIYRLGLHVQLGNLSEAIEDAEWLVRMSPSIAENWYVRGLLHERLGRGTAALADYRKALELKSDLREAKDGLTRLQPGRGRHARPAPPVPNPEPPITFF